MKPLRPILRDNPNERVRTLLRSAKLDVPPSDWKQRAWLAIGPVACLTPTSDIAELSVGNGAGATGAVAPKAATALAAKWAVIGAIAGGSLSATITHAVDRHVDVQRAVSTPTDRQPAPRMRHDTEALQGPSRDTSREPAAAVEQSTEADLEPAKKVPHVQMVAPLPTLSSMKAAVRGDSLPVTRAGMNHTQESHAEDPAHDPPPRAASGTSLGEEVRSLQRIRQLSQEQGAVAALEELDRHERQYPTPGLGIETAVLRIDMLWSAGQHSAAHALAERFLLRHPDCPHAQHVRALLNQKATSRTRSHASTGEEGAQ